MSWIAGVRGAARFALCVSLALSACTPSRKPEMLHGEDGSSTELLRDGQTSLSFSEARSLIGQIYYIGGPSGALGSARVASLIGPDDCTYTAVFEPSPTQEPFIASRKPLTFIPLVPQPSVRDDLAPQIDAFLRAENLSNGVTSNEIWRFDPRGPGDSYLIAVAHTPRDPDEGALAEPGDFDVLFLFRKRDGRPILLDHHLVRTGDIGNMRSYPYPLAVTVDPTDQRVELFVRYRFYEGEEVDGYDLSHDRLQQRTVGAC